MNNALFTLVRTIFTFHTVHESDGTVKFSEQRKLYRIATYVTIHE